MKQPNKLAGKLVLSSAVFAGVMFAGPAISEAALGDRVLKEGMSHNDVKELQDLLKSKGYFTYHTSTGYFGSITKEAVIRFQKANNLPATGIADLATIQALKGTQKNVTAASGNLNVNQVLRIGSRGEQVRLLQTKLKQAGYHTGAVDGIYGSQTAESVRRFQKAKGLLVDGIAGKQTLTALNKINTNGASGSNTSNASTAKKTNTSSTASTTILRIGSTGQAVTQLQNDLKRLGFFAGNATGYYGTATEKAVRDFQKRYRLAVDGIAGPATLGKIAEILNGKDNQAKNGSFNVMNVIADASEFIGVPYVWGGATPSGFDCSGFVYYVFKQSNITLPRTVAQMWNSLKPISQPQVGDLVFFDTNTKDLTQIKNPSHVGIYIGNNKMIQAGSSTGVTISDMTTNYWKSRYLGARRPY